MSKYKNNFEYHNCHNYGKFDNFSVELLIDISEDILSTFNAHLTRQTLVYEMNLTNQSIDNVFDILDKHNAKSIKEYYTILNISDRIATIIFNKVIFNIIEINDK